MSPDLVEAALRPHVDSGELRLDDVVPQARPITVRHVLTYTHGYGVAGSAPRPTPTWPVAGSTCC
ncbi:hypothetical protein AB0C12_18305 [Actinoplanes sp. NPDC048967]|uniref:hypothetical protein n=1 Tax=Actinoplanes sp. NPDC048967 TaxID=3155269 RepID=UPI0033E1336D